MSLALARAASSLVPLASAEGERRWGEAAAGRAAAAHVRAAWQRQRTRTTCGPCSVAVCARALGLLDVTEADVLRRGVAAGVVREADVLKTGVTLAEAASIAEAAGLAARVVYAPTTEEAVEAFCRELARGEGCAIALNYHMTALGQGSGTLRGHVSPLGAYHQQSRSALVMDVWLEETEPVWAPVEQLMESMRGVDDASGLQRGYAVLQRSRG